MSTNIYGVSGWLNVAATSIASARSTGLTAVGDINTALATLAENVEFSVVDEGGVLQFDLDGGGPGSGYSAQGQLIIGAPDAGTAQQVAEAAVTAIATAISGVSPACSVSLQSELGQYVFDQLQ